MIAKKDLVNKLRREIWPAGEPRNLRAVHDQYFIVALMQMQNDFDILRQNNTSVFPFQTKYFDCGKTVVGCPWGKVKRVYTIANQNWCDPVYYRQVSYDVIMEAARCIEVTPPENTGLPTFPKGVRMEETSTDLVSGGYSMRARTGLYAIHNKRLYLWPWTQSNESLVVEYDGIKSEWKDDDALDEIYWHAQAQHLLKLHVEKEHVSRFGEQEERRRLPQIVAEIWELRAQLLQIEKENTWIKNPNPISEGSYLPSKAQIDAEKIPTVTSSVRFAQMADSGDNTSSQDLVAALLELDVQDFLIIAGDVSYGTAYETVVDAKYPSYTVYPARGNHDYDINSGADYATHFAHLENNGVMYEIVTGPVHILIVPSDPREATLGYIDATTSVENGPVGQYIKAKFLLSPAIWKFLFFHHTSYSSGSSHGSALWMDMDFAAMGLTGKIDGIGMGHNHNFEVAIKNGIRYITAGTGGRPLNGFGAPVSGSQFRYSADFGAVFHTVTETTWHYEFRNTAGTVIYEEDVTK